MSTCSTGLISLACLVRHCCQPASMSSSKWMLCNCTAGAGQPAAGLRGARRSVPAAATVLLSCHTIKDHALASCIMYIRLTDCSRGATSTLTRRLQALLSAMRQLSRQLAQCGMAAFARASCNKLDARCSLTCAAHGMVPAYFSPSTMPTPACGAQSGSVYKHAVASCSNNQSCLKAPATCPRVPRASRSTAVSPAQHMLCHS